MSIRSAMTQLLDFTAGRVECRVAPTEWMVETTSRCNLKCPMCPREKTPYPPEDMDLEFYKQLILQHPHLEAVWPYGFGEPLLHPHIFEMIRWAKQKRKAVSLSTNATLLNRERASLLLASGLDYLILAVDGTDAVYSRNRFPAHLTDVESQIEDFLALKVNTGSSLHVTLQMVRMKNNRDQVSSFRLRWKRPGVDAIRVRDDLSGITGISIESHRRRVPRRPCFFLWRGPLFVEAPGTVIPCPYYHGSAPFAEVRSQLALHAWNSPAMRALRAAHVKGDLSHYPKCLRCPRHQPARLLAGISFFVNTHHIRRVFPSLENIQRRLGLKLFE
ncbi:MAG TPA: radical SAM protein [Acidobacteriota bacterium]|nr:radical SAM protein [Acidobacteriota bacterium]